MAIHKAELHLLTAMQRAARQQVVGAVDAALRDRHAGTVAIVVARFAGRRAALVTIADPGARAAAARQIAAEEAAELARLALEHAAEKRQLKQAALAPLAAAQNSARRGLRQRQRHQRAGIAVQLRALRPNSAAQARRRSTAHDSYEKPRPILPHNGGRRH